MNEKHRNNIILTSIATIVFILWHIPEPSGITTQAWHCLIIFAGIIMLIISSSFNISFVALLGGNIAILTRTLTFNDIFAEFGSKIIWMVIFAFFIAKAFVKTGLGHRLAYIFIKFFGKSIYGLAYGLIMTEFLLSPLIPSLAARSGGIIYPIAKSILNAYADDESKEEDIRKNGAYLMNVCCHASIVCSAMFLTAMAGNPLTAELAHRMGIYISWSTWAAGAILPGIVCLILLPWTIKLSVTPGICKSDNAPLIAEKALKEMGRLKIEEIKMIFIFLLLITFWIAESYIKIDASTTALTGVMLIMLSNILKWQDAIEEKNAWDTMIWFAILLAFSTQLGNLGVMKWLADFLNIILINFKTPLAIWLLLCCIYFYIHYFFASLTAHITVFYTLFLNLMIQSNLPPLSSALLLAYLSNLYGGLTHYASSTSPIFFGANFQSTKDWLKTGALTSSIHFLVWIVLSSIWLPIMSIK